MGGPCRLRVDCDDSGLVSRALRITEEELARLEARYSRYREDSLISRINRSAGREAVVIDPETAGLLAYADQVWRHSDGLFDPTSGVLRQAWNFRGSALPSQAQLQPLLALVGWKQVRWSEKEVFLELPGMELDLGGCVKEYACDVVVSRLQELGVRHALIDLAGDMAVTGPQGDGSPWRIGVQHPLEDRALAWVPLSTGALASSGDYRRCLVVEGKRYGHILNPRTAWPVQGLAAASVVAPQCLVAGSAATVALLKAEQEGLAWLEGFGLPWLAVDRAMQVHGTGGDTSDDGR